MSTYFPKAQEIQREWFIVDATDVPVGRLSTVVADVLSGKTKPSWTPFLDTGDHVIVVNAAKATFTGRKETTKMYHRTTNQPGSIKSVRADVMRAKFPERIVEEAVKGMLPKGPLGKQMYRKLRVYAGSEHEHAAQQPQELKIQL